MGLSLSILRWPRERFLRDTSDGEQELTALTAADHVHPNGTNQLLPGIGAHQQPGDTSDGEQELTALTAADHVHPNGTNQLLPGIGAHQQPGDTSDGEQERAPHTAIDIDPGNNGENGTESNDLLPGIGAHQQPGDTSDGEQERPAHTAIDIDPGNNGENGTESNDHDHIKTIFTFYITCQGVIVAAATSMRGHAVYSAERKTMGFLSPLVSTAGLATFVVIFFQGFTHRRGAGQPLRISLVENWPWLTKRVAVLVFFSMLSVSFWHICNLMLKSHHE